MSIVRFAARCYPENSGKKRSIRFRKTSNVQNAGARSFGEMERGSFLREKCNAICAKFVPSDFPSIRVKLPSPFFLALRVEWVLNAQDVPGSYEEFWFFCFHTCPKVRVGCANSCKFREKLGIPPFGNSYAGKLEGRIPE